MKLFSVEKLRIRPAQAAKVHEAVATVPTSEHIQVSAPTQVSSELLYELQSAASMIMDPEECEGLLKELDHLRQSHRVAA